MAPELAPFMADELLLSMPEVEGIDYTMKEYMKLVEQTKQCVERLNAQGETLRVIDGENIFFLFLEEKIFHFNISDMFLTEFCLQAGRSGHRTRWRWRSGLITS